jgi:hypothetical protein
VPFIRHLVTFACSLWVALVLARPRFIDWAMTDDAYYYFGIARNLASGSGSTFDRLHTTNDYQPLWLGISTLPFYLDFDDEKAVFALFGMQMIALAVAIHVAIRTIEHNAVLRTTDSTLRRRGATLACLAACILVLSPWGIAIFANGTETALALVFFAAIVERLDSGVATDADRRTLAALLVALIAVRLDAVVLLVFLIYAGRRRGWTRREIVDVAIAPLVVLCAYMLCQLVWFRVPLPTGRPWAFSTVRSIVGLALAISPFVLVPLIERARGSIFPRTAKFLADTAPALAFAIAIVGFQKATRPHLEAWQLALPIFYLVMVFAMMVLDLAVITDRRPRLLAPILVLACIGVFARGVKDMLTPTETTLSEAQREAALWMTHNFALSGVVGAWHAGSLGYWSHRRVVALDGAAGSVEYSRAVRRRTTNEWHAAQRVPVDYVVVAAFEEDVADLRARELAINCFGDERVRTMPLIHQWRFWYSGRAEGKWRRPRTMNLRLARLD